MIRALTIVLAVGVSTPAFADQLEPQIQADLGLSVVFAAYEYPVTSHIAVEAGGGIFGTYFLPWFDAGEDVKGFGGGVRATWFSRTSGRGLYVAPYFRAIRVTGELDGASGSGPAVTSGVFVGWAFGLTDKLDLRVGGGAQYIYSHVETAAGDLDTSTPFVALDLVVGYRY